MRKGWMHTAGFEGQERFAPRTLADSVYIDESLEQTVAGRIAALPSQQDVLQMVLDNLPPVEPGNIYLEVELPAFTEGHSLSLEGVTSRDSALIDLIYNDNYDADFDEFEKISRAVCGDGVIDFYSVREIERPLQLKIIL